MISAIDFHVFHTKRHHLDSLITPLHEHVEKRIFNQEREDKLYL